MDTPETPIQRAAGRVGGMKALAEMLGKSKQAANGWRKQVPTDLCPLIELYTGVKCEELRPDVRWDVLRSQKKGKA